jgi:hypothetical protein
MRPFTLAPTHRVADVGVNGVGEIDGRGVARQHDHLPLGRERVGLFGVQVHLQRGHELAGVLHLALPLHQVAQPGDALIVRRRALAALFVFPVRGDAFLGDAVHFLGADLHFERLPLRSDHGSVQRLIQIGPRNGDEILDAARNGAPVIVDDAERGVAVLHRIGENAQRHQIVDLIDGDLLPLQLHEDGVGRLTRPSMRAGMPSRRSSASSVRRISSRNSWLEWRRLSIEATISLIGVGLEVLKRQVLQLAAHLAHAEPVRDGRVDLDRLARDPLPPLGRRGSRACACCGCGRPA